jgi:hypothetical protein
MFEKKQINFKSPDLSKTQEVVIDHKTRIYIALDADPVEAKNLFLSRLLARNKPVIAGRKPQAS